MVMERTTVATTTTINRAVRTTIANRVNQIAALAIAKLLTFSILTVACDQTSVTSSFKSA